MKVLIIDSGISAMQATIENTTTLQYKDGKLIKSSSDCIGHGTAIYHILRKSITEEIISVKFDFDDLESNEDDFIKLLEVVYNDLEFDLIHLSIGVTYCEKIEELRGICKKISQKAIIVSAYSNDGFISYPAAFDFVIGVDMSYRCMKLTDFEFVENSPVNILASSSQQYLPYKNDEFVMLTGNSFAAPHISVEIFKLLKLGFNTFDLISEQLKNKAKYKHKFNLVEKEMESFNINKAITFPFNKEIHSLIRFEKKLAFKIENVYDLKYLRSINQKTETILYTRDQTSYQIKNYENIEWDSDFDTLILGHMREINELKKMDIRKLFLEKAIEFNKNIFSFDDLSSYSSLLQEMESKGLKYYYPIINKSSAPQNTFGKLYPITCPTIGIFGTSSRQGKFTLQMELRNRFHNEGYSVGQLGTEPSALLYGLDLVYPMGYDGVIETREFESVATINYMMNKINNKKPNIIIVGSQSQTVSYATSHLSLLPIHQYQFLLGTTPDTCILCVNVDDDFSYIMRTIKFIESSIDTIVIALVISPIIRTYDNSSLVRSLNIYEDSILLESKNNIQNACGKKAFILNREEDLNRLYTEIIDFF